MTTPIVPAAGVVLVGLAIVLGCWRSRVGRVAGFGTALALLVSPAVLTVQPALAASAPPVTYSQFDVATGQFGWVRLSWRDAVFG